MRDKKKSSDTKKFDLFEAIIFSFKSFSSTSRLCLLKQKHISAFCTSLLVTTIFKGFFVGNKKKGIQRRQKVYADVVKNHRSFITLDSLLPLHPCPSPCLPSHLSLYKCIFYFTLDSIYLILPPFSSLSHSLTASLCSPFLPSHLPLFTLSLSFCLSSSSSSSLSLSLILLPSFQM